MDYVAEMSRGLEYDTDVNPTEEVQHPSQSVTLTSKDEALYLSDDVAKANAEGEEGDVYHDGDGDEGDEFGDFSDLPSGAALSRFRRTVTEGVAVKEYKTIRIAKTAPYIQLQSVAKADRTLRVFDAGLTSQYLSAMHAVATQGVSFAGQAALVTGAGEGSIAIELVKSLLEGGATVVVAVHRTGDRLQQRLGFLRSVFEEYEALHHILFLPPLLLRTGLIPHATLI